MKFEVLRENFSKALNISLKAISVKSSLPILQNFLIESDNGQLKIIATDLDKSIVTWVGAKIEGEGSITVPAKALQGFINGLKDEKILGEIKNENLLLKTKTSEAKFNGTSSEEYPSLDYSISEDHIVVNSDILRRSVDETYFSSSIDDSRPAWTGILIKQLEDALHFVGLDGFRLARKKIAVSELSKMKSDFKEVIIPAKNFLEVLRLAPKNKEIKVDIQANKSTVVFDLDDLFFISKILDGEFPDYDSVIPSSPILTFTVPYQDLLDAVKISSVFARENNAVRLKITSSSNLLEILSDDVELGNHKQQITLKNVVGDDLELAFKVNYLLDYLNNVPSEEIEIKCSGQNSAAIFMPTGREDYLHIAVPLQPYWEN